MIKWGKLFSRIRAGSRICQSGRSGNGGSCSVESGQAAGFVNPAGAGTGGTGEAVRPNPGRQPDLPIRQERERGSKKNIHRIMKVGAEIALASE